MITLDGHQPADNSHQLSGNSHQMLVTIARPLALHTLLSGRKFRHAELQESGGRLEQALNPSCRQRREALAKASENRIIDGNHARLASVGFCRYAHFGGFFMSGTFL